MKIFASLNRQQREAVGLLQIGTFLEYFDLMLYVHMAVLLNELFFPKTDPHTAALLAAFAFCSTWILRPFGALLFGWIGDNIGRKPTVIITTLMMSLSCVVMANLPTYEQIGIAAAWIVTGCRLMQGMSSMGEIIGAQVYVSELVKPPTQYPAVGIISVAATLGGVAALGFATLVSCYECNWRIAFWAGAGVAVIGSIARIRLREVPEFVKAKYRNPKKIHPVDIKTSLRSLLIYFGSPLSFYIAYMYFNTFLKVTFNCTPTDIIHNNLFVSLVHVFSLLFFVLLSYKVHPLRLLKIKAIIFLGLVLLIPFVLMWSNITKLHVTCLQSALIAFGLSDCLAFPALFKAVHMFKRITVSSFLYAVSRACIYISTSFGLVYCSEWLEHFGIWVISLPVCIAFIWSVQYFQKLEQAQALKITQTQKSSEIKTVAAV